MNGASKDTAKIIELLKSQAGPVLALSLADALRMALENNLDLEIAEISTETARFDAIGSWGAFDPTVNLNAAYTERDELGTSSLSGAPSSTVERKGSGSSVRPHSSSRTPRSA